MDLFELLLLSKIARNTSREPQEPERPGCDAFGVHFNSAVELGVLVFVLILGFGVVSIIFCQLAFVTIPDIIKQIGTILQAH